MLRFFARFWAKRKYIFNTEFEAATHEMNAALSAQRAKDAREMIAQANKEADDIEKRIAEVAVMEEKGFWLCEDGQEVPKCSLALCDEHEAARCNECKTGKKACPVCDKPMKLIKRSEMTGQEKYESDQQRKEAEKIVESKREYAKQQEEQAKGGEDTARHFRREAARSHELADRLRHL